MSEASDLLATAFASNPSCTANGVDASVMIIPVIGGITTTSVTAVLEMLQVLQQTRPSA
jgi:hypothetical protein